MKQIGDRTSELYLPSHLSFDSVLDFLYCTTVQEEEDFLFNVKNGLSLYKVAEYFKIKPLQMMLSNFYRETTMPFNVVEFIDGATTLQSKDMFNSGIEQFAQSMHTLDYVEEEKLNPFFLLKALKKRKELGISQTKKDSDNISCLIALCTKHYKDKLTRPIFYKLTQEAYIPYIDQEAALQLLTVESELQYWTDTDNFSTLQARCIHSLLSDWVGLRQKFESDGAFWKTLRGLSQNVLGILLMQSTGTSQGGGGGHEDYRRTTEAGISPATLGNPPASHE
jgi:hypothetical protein